MFGFRIHRAIYLGGLYSMAAGMMLFPLVASLPHVILAGNWLLEGNFAEKWKQIKHNKLIWLLSGIYIWHLLALFYSNDWNEGLNDLRVKLPLLALPLVLFTTAPLTSKQWARLWMCFIAGAFASTAWSLIHHWLHPAGDSGRNISLFMSHIRLGLFINMAIVCCIYLIGFFENRKLKLLFGALCVYFIMLMPAMGLASGIVVFIILFSILLLMWLFRQKFLLRLSILIIAIALGGVAGYYTYSFGIRQLSPRKSHYNIPHDINAAGRPLIHFDTCGQKENGNYVLINIQMEDLRKAWNQKVPADSFNYLPEHNLQRYDVLLRYLSSCSLPKDDAGVNQLTDEDVRLIREGICNYRYPLWNPLQRRLYEMVNEYDEFMQDREVNGHSLTMRAYFWQGAFKLIEQKPLFGGGTGSSDKSLKEIYPQIHSPLKPAWYKRPHNQFLSIAVNLGIFGLLFFLTAMFYPLCHLRKHLSYMYFCFFTALVLSFVTEDTLETQAGVSFYVFFNTLLLSQAWFKMKQTPADLSVSH